MAETVPSTPQLLLGSTNHEPIKVQGPGGYFNPQSSAPILPNGQPEPTASYGGVPTMSQPPSGQRSMMPMGVAKFPTPPQGNPYPGLPPAMGPPPIGQNTYPSYGQVNRSGGPPINGNMIGTTQPRPQATVPSYPPPQTLMNGPSQMLGPQNSVTNGIGLAHAQGPGVPPSQRLGPPMAPRTGSSLQQQSTPQGSGPQPGRMPPSNTSNADWQRYPPTSLHVNQAGRTWPQPPPTSGSSIAPSPATSEPPSAKSSRNPSPIPSQRYDAMEGQFAPTLNSPPNNMAGPPKGNANQLLPTGPPAHQPWAPPFGHQGFPQQQQQFPAAPPTTQAPPAAPVPQFIPAQPPPLRPASQPPMFQPNNTLPPPTYQTNSGPQMPPTSQPAGIRPTNMQQPPPQAQHPPPMATAQSSILQPLQPAVPNNPPMAGQSQYQRQPYQQQYPGSSVPGPNTHSQNNYGSAEQLGQRMSHMGFQGSESIDLLHERNILSPTPVEPPQIILPNYDQRTPNCSPDIFRCTLTRIPESQSVLQKCRLPLGILIHPFKDLVQLPVVQCNVIVRCRACRTYINPFVQFLDQHRWKCNLCYRVNELQEEFQYDPISRTYGDPTRRPEIKSATIEFIAPSEYMLRPPQPAVYLFVLDVSYGAVETGYLKSFCDTLLEELQKLPGDSRTRVGFITVDSALHFYNLAEGLSQPQMMVVSDIDDVFLPCPDNLLVNLHESMDLVRDLLQQLPLQFIDGSSTDSALGAALQAAFKLVSPTGGRITVVQGSLPNIGPGALKSREDPNLRAGKVRTEHDDTRCCLLRQAELDNYIFREHVCDVPNLGPANDFYKKLSLNCSGQQVAVDLFLVSSQYCDIATLSCISKYSGGCINYYPGFHAQSNVGLAEKFEQDLKRYLTRKVGFEAVMRIRCTKGLSIHTFHGNFFVRSTDLLSLPNINPDAGFGMQMSIEESLTECNTTCFQAALLYTSSKGERRIRVHTLCLPVSTSVSEIIATADQQAIVGLLTKMAVDRSLTSSMSDARDALINACVDALSAYKLIQGGNNTSLLVPASLKLLPMYILAILKHMAFRLGTSTKLDERVHAMNQMKTLPLAYLMTYIYPNLYAVHNLETAKTIMQNDTSISIPALLHLSAEKFERAGVFLLDTSDRLFLYVCQGVSNLFCQNVLNVKGFDAIPDNMIELPDLETVESDRLRSFVGYLQSQRPFHATFQVIKNNSKDKQEFLQHIVEDRSESTYSYYEFLKHIHQLMSK